MGHRLLRIGVAVVLFAVGVVTANADTKFCGECAKPRKNPGDTFCRACGASLKQQTSPLRPVAMQQTSNQRRPIVPNTTTASPTTGKGGGGRKWGAILGGVLVALVVLATIVSLMSDPKSNASRNTTTLTPTTDRLRTEKYIIAGSEIYKAAIRNDSARVLEVCRQVDEALQQEADQRHDHDLLVEPCNDVERGGSAVWIKSEVGTMLPPADARKQENVVAINVRGEDARVISSYKVAHEQCSIEPERIYEESGTTTAEGAARWMSETWIVGPLRDSGYQGCLDALVGNLTKYPE